ncbi:LPS translocon maturation chaperone LptM [Roseomonas elaeocarpi]|uniref:Argininosuccinate lyase n=1 Tax=Roseomonas elaeocarpi TaxID=907779 RepID=A0ABV6JM42_9PROT
MHRIIAAVLPLLLLGLTLAACGRTGPIRPPGPQSEITYPRAYPSK